MAQAEETSGDDWGKRIMLAVLGLGMLGGVYVLDEALPGPEGSQRLYNRGLGYYQDKKYDDALNAFNRALKLNPTVYQAYFVRASIERSRDELDHAIADYDSVIRLKGDEQDAFYNRGLTYRDLGEPEKALADFDVYVRLKPSDPDGHLRRAELLAGLGERDRALAERDTLVRTYDHQLSYQFGRATLRRDYGDLAGALRDLDAVIALAPENVQAHWLRGLMWRENGDTERAIADFARAIALKADDLRAYLARGEALRDAGRLDDAKAEFDGALKRVLDDATALHQRGLLALLTGDIAAARADLDAAVEKGIAYRNNQRILTVGMQMVMKQYDVASTADTGPVLARDVPFYPAIYGLVVWRHIAHLRAGEVDDADFKRRVADLGVDRWREADLAASPLRTPWRRRVTWPAPILGLFAGKASPQAVRSAVQATPGSYERSRRQCAADFFIAEYQLFKGARDEALALLQSATAGCPAAAPEATFAKAELARLAAGQTGQQ